MRRVERYFFLLLQVYLGAFNLASGLNYFAHVWPQPVPADPVGSAYMHVTLQLGMFQFAKVIETVAGFCLVADLYVPLALIVLFPITLNVFIMDTFFAKLAHVQVSGARNFAFHLLLLAAYGGYYRALLRPASAITPLWRGPAEHPGAAGVAAAEGAVPRV